MAKAFVRFDQALTAWRLANPNATKEEARAAEARMARDYLFFLEVAM